LPDADRQLLKAGIASMPLEPRARLLFCAHAIPQPDQAMADPDAALDPRFADNPIASAPSCVRFYAGVLLAMRKASCLARSA
jgi:hypothetical protein